MFPTKTKVYNQLSFADIKNYLEIDESDTSQDALIQSLMYASISICEKYIDDDIVTTTCSLEQEQYIVPLTQLYYKIMQHNITVTSITLYTGNGASGSTTVQTLVPFRDYQVEKFNNYTGIRYTNGITANKIVIVYQSGYPTIPFDVVLAIKMQIASLYDANRTGYVMNNAQMTNAWERILMPHRRLLYD